MEAVKKKLTLVIPALNEEQGIERTIRAVPVTELQDMHYDVEILVVDNGSTDQTAEIARKAGARVVFEPVRGYGKAYKTGFSEATGYIIATTDADASYPVEDIPRLVKILEDEGLDFLSTIRLGNMEKGAMSVQNKIGNFVLNMTSRVLFQINIHDSQSGMWVFKKRLLDKMILRSDGMPLSEELKLEAFYFNHCKWKEIPIKYRARAGKVKLRTWQDGFSNLLYLVRKRVAR